MVSPSKKSAATKRDVTPVFLAHPRFKSQTVGGSSSSSIKKLVKLKRKSYKDKVIFLDLKNQKDSIPLELALKNLGASIALYFDRRVDLVVSDRIDISSPSVSLSNNSPAASGSPFTPQSFISPESSGTAEKTNHLPRCRSSTMLERCTSAVAEADPVSLARQWTIPVYSVIAIWNEIRQYRKSAAADSLIYVRKARKLHFVKIEDSSRNRKPELFKVDCWPHLDLEGLLGQSPFNWDASHSNGVVSRRLSGTMTRRSYKSCEVNDNAPLSETLAKFTNGHITRQSSHELLKVQCNGLSPPRNKLLSPSGSDVLPLTSSGSNRRSGRRASASWCGSTRDLADDLSPTDTELGIALRPKTCLWQPVALIAAYYGPTGTTAEEHGRSTAVSNANENPPAQPKRKKLSPEEKLLRDNKHYFKMEVLNTKLRSSGSLPSSYHIENNKRKVDEPDENVLVKVNGVQQKKKRRTELMKLCDEAETFMFGECSRSTAADSMDVSTEKEEGTTTTTTTKREEQEVPDDEDEEEEEEKPKRKRRSHAEVFIHDNLDYYKFETFGSRLRAKEKDVIKEEEEEEENGNGNEIIKIEAPVEEEDVAKVQFSFECTPASEPWYETYRRQDENRENIYPMLSNPADQPFLLPYELPRAVWLNSVREFAARTAVNDMKNRGGGRKGLRGVAVSAALPRKSPRCHASTLAILSSMRKRKRRSGGEDSAGGGSPPELASIEEVTPVEEICLIEPEDLAQEAKRGRPQKRADLRYTVRRVDSEAVIISSRSEAFDVFDFIESFSDCSSALQASVPTDSLKNSPTIELLRGRRRHRKKVNRTGWEKPKKRRDRTRILNHSLTGSNNNNVEEKEMDLTPCVVRVQKLRLSRCSDDSEKAIGKKKRRRKRKTDYAWTGKNKRR